ncbi:hypothetical protein ACPCBX_04285 [Streptomyces tuirus]|uniref:Uncharacterized protein n=1 Tax=Streptomyces tuirus TaxID=68278 RepID=A0A7G1NLD2_9ACTN|nr:hypothetical protein [Streptomyces tuirus]BCL23968.1 hypothetical protein GCM10017668_58110 [Streptomyces tuirus]
MPSASRSHRSYRADVLLVPLEPRSRAAVLNPAPHDALDGIVIAGPDTPSAGTGSAPGGLSRPDVVVMLAHDLAAVDPGLVTRLGISARASGALVGAIVISPDRSWHGPQARRTATELRATADTVVVLADMAPAVALLRVLRGGPRTADTPGPI